MKKFLISMIMVLSISFGTVAVGCSGNDSPDASDNASSNTSEPADLSSSQTSVKEENGQSVDGNFVWEDGKYIVNLSDEGAGKTEIVVPQNCDDIKIKDWAGVDDNLFSNNDNIQSLFFESESIKSLPDGFLRNDKNLKNVVLPKNLKKVPEFIFSKCDSIESVEIPDKVTEIEENAFEFTNLKELNLPESVTTLGESLFRGTAIEKLYIPESVTSISNSLLAFRDSEDPNYKLTVYVKQGSYADEHFDDFGKRDSVEKAYY